MIMVRSNDILQSGLAVASRIRIHRVDVTDISATLSYRHLCGPSASMALAEALAAAALLGAEASRPEETVSFRMRLDGPVGGLVAEATSDGTLRGYPNVKIINALDGAGAVDVSAALGESAQVQIVRSVPGRILSQTSLSVHPASVEAALEQYYARSDQRRVLVALSSLCLESEPGPARGMSVELLPDGDADTFEALASAFEKGIAFEALDVEDGLRNLANALGLEDPRIDPPRPLRFACRCSREKAQTMLSALGHEELVEMAALERPLKVFCHMCGEGYEIEPNVIRKLVKPDR